MSDLADQLSKLMGDSNAKIQQISLARFLVVLPDIIRFVENNIITFLSSLLNNLGSSNIMVKKQTESILSKIKESIDKQILLQPIVNIIQFSSNSR